MLETEGDGVMTFTRIHYGQVAKILRTPRQYESAWEYRRSVIQGFAGMFGDDNKRFNYKRFIDAITYSDRFEHDRYLARCRGESA